MHNSTIQRKAGYSPGGKRKTKQSLMPVLRESTKSYHSEKMRFDIDFDDVQAVVVATWGSRALEQCWSECSAPAALVEAIYYPETHMYVAKAISRNLFPDMSSEPTPQQEVLLAQAPLRVAVPVIGPAPQTDDITLRVAAAVAMSKYFSKTGHNYCVMGTIDQGHDAQVSDQLHIDPRLQGHLHGREVLRVEMLVRLACVEELRLQEREARPRHEAQALLRDHAF